VSACSFCTCLDTVATVRVVTNMIVTSSYCPVCGIAILYKFPLFVLFDHFNVPKTAGFPDHPYRGHETITYILKGKLAHENFTGVQKALLPGDLQFMRYEEEYIQ
jgi:hypothetical protein